VAEPVIQQQGLDRIVVQLPGVQDTAKAKDILGRTATLEVRMVDESTEARAAEQAGGIVPFGAERYMERDGRPLIVKKQVVLTGDNLTDAQPGFDGQTQEPVVNLTLDAKGARIFKDVTRDNVGKRMAIILFEKGKGEVVTAPVIRAEIGGGRVQISGRMTTAEANDTALLLRAGSLAAPMEIIEERTIGLQQRDLGFPGDRGFHGRLLRHVRFVLRHRTGCEPVVPGGHLVDAASHADPARHGRDGARFRYGDRLERADQRARTRRAAQWGQPTGGHPRRLRPRLGHDF
jgi:hypothetical protein